MTLGVLAPVHTWVSEVHIVKPRSGTHVDKSSALNVSGIWMIEANMCLTMRERVRAMF